jgi:hypothetical protein
MIEGTVEAVSTKYDKFSILLGGVWYGTKFPPAPAPVAGDTVRFDNGGEGKKFINKLVIDGGSTAAVGGVPTPAAKAATGSGFPVPPLDRSRAIIRQNALAHAVQICMNAGNWDLDREEAEAFAASKEPS